MSDILDDVKSLLGEGDLPSRDAYEELIDTLIEIMPTETYTFMGIQVNIKDRLIEHMNDHRLEVIKLLNQKGNKLIKCIKNVTK